MFKRKYDVIFIHGQFLLSCCCILEKKHLFDESVWFSQVVSIFQGSGARVRSCCVMLGDHYTKPKICTEGKRRGSIIFSKQDFSAISITLPESNIALFHMDARLLFPFGTWDFFLFSGAKIFVKPLSPIFRGFVLQISTPKSLVLLKSNFDMSTLSKAAL